MGAFVAAIDASGDIVPVYRRISSKCVLLFRPKLIIILPSWCIHRSYCARPVVLSEYQKDL